jgi:hypothetical protein
MDAVKPYPKVYVLMTPAEAEDTAAGLQAGDADWKYVAKHDPKGTGHSFVEIYDEEGEFVGRC